MTKSQLSIANKRLLVAVRHFLALHFPRPIALVLIAFILLGLIYEAVTPIFEAGDEPWHYPYVRHIAGGYGLPYQDPNQIQAWRQEGSQPPLYYMLAALATFWIDTSDADERLTVNPHAIVGVPAHGVNDNRNMMMHTPAEYFPYRRTTLAVHWIRWLSVLMGTGTIYAVYRIAQRITPYTLTPLLAASFVAFNPMFGFLSAAINNDNLAILLSALSLWQMVRIWQDGVTARRVLTLGVLLGLASLSKLNALGLIGVGGLLVLARVWREPNGKTGASRRSLPLLSTFTSSLILVASVLLIAGWWYARNWLLYGDPTGLNRMLAIVGTRQGTPQPLPLLQAEIRGFLFSFWGLFGGVNVLAAPWVYVSFEVLSYAACIGLAFLVVRYLFQRHPLLPFSLSVTSFFWLAFWLFVLLIAWMRWTLITPATQGRLIFPALATIAIALAVGLTAFLELLEGIAIRLLRLNQGERRWTFSAWAKIGMRDGCSLMLIAVLFLVSLRTALFDIAPAYTPAPLLSAVPPSAAREPIRFGELLELVGLETPTTAAHSGELIEVTAYWRAVGSANRDYSVFVHLLDEGDLIVGQRDTHTGLGLRPTSQLRPGDLLRDVYRIRIDDSAIAPSQPQIRIGVYDFATGQRLPSAKGDNPTVGKISLLAKPDGNAPNPVVFRFEDYFTLTGYRVDRVVVYAGDSLTLTLYWRANRVPRDYSIFTHILGKHDSLWGQIDRQLPMRSWQNGELIEDVYVIQVKPDTPPDVYDVEIGAYDLDDNFKRLNIWGADGQFAGDRILLRKIRVVR